MKFSTTLNETVGNLKCAIFAYDVSKDALNFFSRIGTKTYERCFSNRSDIVETQLGIMVDLAKKAGMEKILVVAESTGRYHEVLMMTARRLGLKTAWVSGEAVAKSCIVSSSVLPDYRVRSARPACAWRVRPLPQFVRRWASG